MQNIVSDFYTLIPIQRHYRFLKFLRLPLACESRRFFFIGMQTSLSFRKPNKVGWFVAVSATAEKEAVCLDSVIAPQQLAHRNRSADCPSRITPRGCEASISILSQYLSGKS